ncbi:unnamed protein product [Ascophyllum nodosum]
MFGTATISTLSRPASGQEHPRSSRGVQRTPIQQQVPASPQRPLVGSPPHSRQGVGSTTGAMRYGGHKPVAASPVAPSPRVRVLTGAPYDTLPEGASATSLQTSVSSLLLSPDGVSHDHGTQGNQMSVPGTLENNSGPTVGSARAMARRVNNEGADNTSNFIDMLAQKLPPFGGSLPSPSPSPSPPIRKSHRLRPESPLPQTRGQLSIVPTLRRDQSFPPANPSLPEDLISSGVGDFHPICRRNSVDLDDIFAQPTRESDRHNKEAPAAGYGRNGGQDDFASVGFRPQPGDHEQYFYDFGPLYDSDAGPGGGDNKNNCYSATDSPTSADAAKEGPNGSLFQEGRDESMHVERRSSFEKLKAMIPFISQDSMQVSSGLASAAPPHGNSTSSNTGVGASPVTSPSSTASTPSKRRGDSRGHDDGRRKKPSIAGLDTQGQKSYKTNPHLVGKRRDGSNGKVPRGGRLGNANAAPAAGRPQTAVGLVGAASPGRGSAMQKRGCRRHGGAEQERGSRLAPGGGALLTTFFPSVQGSSGIPSAYGTESSVTDGFILSSTRV